MMRENENVSMTGVLLWSVFVILLFIFFLIVFGAFTPIFLDQEREAVEHSRQYLTSQTTAINGFISQYNDVNVSRLEVINNNGSTEIVNAYNAQLLAILNQICSVYNSVDSDVRTEFSDYIQNFVEEHPCS